MFGFIIAVIAGFLVPHADEPLGRPVLRAIRPYLKVEDREERLFVFLLIGLIAALVIGATASTSAFWVIAGLGVGYFATRLVEAAKAGLDSRKGD